MGYHKYLWVVVAMGLQHQCYCGSEKLLFGARSQGLGNASVALADISSAMNNQAGLGFLETTGVTTFTEQRFMLKEIRFGGIAAVLPTTSGTFSLSTTYFGYNHYNNSQIGLGYGLKLSDDFSFGAQINYQQTSMVEYGNRSNITFEVGIMAKMTNQLTFAAHIYNPIRANMGEYLGISEKTSGILRAGLSYFEKSKYLITAEVEKDMEYDPFIKAGIEVYLSTNFTARAGVSTRPSSFSLGLGYKMKRVHIDIAGTRHEYLGMTPSASLTYYFTPPKHVQ